MFPLMADDISPQALGNGAASYHCLEEVSRISTLVVYELLTSEPATGHLFKAMV